MKFSEFLHWLESGKRRVEYRVHWQQLTGPGRLYLMTPRTDEPGIEDLPTALEYARRLADMTEGQREGAHYRICNIEVKIWEEGSAGQRVSETLHYVPWSVRWG